MKIIYQENNPHRARTYRSTAEAFRELPYTCALQRFPSPRRMWRIVDAACLVLSALVLSAAWWWPW